MSNVQLNADELRWSADHDSKLGAAPRRIKGRTIVVGQPRARIALRSALTLPGTHAHAFVRGPAGSGRRTLIRSVIEELAPQPRRSVDFCYVHNFRSPERPRLIVLPGGQGRQLQSALTQLALFVRDRLPTILSSDPIRSRREARLESAERDIRLKVAPLEERLKEEKLALVRSQSGPSTRVSVYPLVMGKAVSPEEYRNLVTRQQAHEHDRLKALENIRKWQGEVNKLAREISQTWQQAMAHIDQINASEAARMLSDLTADISGRFKAEGLEQYLTELIDDVVEKRLGSDTSHVADPTLIYAVNVLTSREEREHAPVVWATQPSVANLFGTVDPSWTRGGRAVSSFRGIRTGALHQADGGFLIIDANHLLAEEDAWPMLARALRTNQVEVIPPKLGWPSNAFSLRPEGFPVDVKVILIGDDEAYHALQSGGNQFPELFGMLVELDHTLERNQQGIEDYSRYLSQLVEREGLRPFSTEATLAMVEQGARLSPEPGRLSARFGVLSEIAREASGRARDEDAAEVLGKHVDRALRQRRERNGLPMLRVRRQLDQGCLRLAFGGQRLATINTVTSANGSYFPYPQAIGLQAMVSRYDRPDIYIDGEPAQDGLIDHLAQILRCRQIPAIRAVVRTLNLSGQRNPSGDNGLQMAQLILLLASMAGVPLKQGIAALGSLDVPAQAGFTDALNERIEVFFELCKHTGLNGEQGVIIPSICRHALMLDQNIVDACRDGQFAVWAVDSVEQALPLMTGLEAGDWSGSEFEPGSLLNLAREFLD